MVKRKNIFFTLTTVIGFAVSLILFPACNSKGAQSKTGDQQLREIKIGVILPLTGNFASYGQMSLKGIQLAVKKWQQEKKNFEIKLIVENDLSTTIGAVNSTKKLLDIEKTPIIIGGIASSIALAIGPITEDSKVLFMCAFASSPRLADAGKYFFKIMPSDAFQSILLVKWFKELKYQKVGIVHVLSEWGEALKSNFENEFTFQKGQIVFIEGCNEGQKDFKEIISKLKKKKNEIDVIFSPTYPKEGGSFLKQLKEMKINLPIFGADPWANGEIINIAGDSADGAKFLAPMQYEGPEYQKFKNAFVEEYKVDPDLTAGAGYDSADILILAINNLIIANSEVNSDNLKSELLKMDNYIGVTGKAKFDDKGNVISKEFGKRVIRNGKIEKYD